MYDTTCRKYRTLNTKLLTKIAFYLNGKSNLTYFQMFINTLFYYLYSPASPKRVWYVYFNTYGKYFAQMRGSVCGIDNASTFHHQGHIIYQTRSLSE